MNLSRSRRTIGPVAIFCLSLTPLLAAAPPTPPADPFKQNVRPTDALSPQQEAASFHMPPGFEIQLVAAEPEIGKPFNLAFDGRGRLWVTCSREYPFPAKPPTPGHDSIKVLEDFDAAGHARKITTFVEGLNIPVGLYPYRNGVIAFSIPDTTFYEDTDGDGKADKSTVLVGPWGYDRDTHGMSSNYRRGLDGFVYGCHGFNNTSNPKARDGSELTLVSGNTYRFMPDGTHLQQFTWGQTNPFGLCWDPMGNLYSSDSHSKPIYQLLRGGSYEAIFRPPADGLGFAPHMMTHLHNSTAIASVTYYDGDQFPPEYRGRMYVGNVVTSRINQDTISFHGSSPVATEAPDFLTTDDPWFRPVNNLLGPDGTMYVADFYNKIIGHYEVPLNHPGRDHDHGRIWRIVYKGTRDHPATTIPLDLTTASVEQLLATLSADNIALRMLATDQLSDRIGQAAAEPIRKLLGGNPTDSQKVHGLWVLYRLEKLETRDIATAAADPEPRVRVHAMRLLAETPPVSAMPGEAQKQFASQPKLPQWTAEQRALALAGLNDKDPLVVRCAADALAQHPVAEDVRPLIDRVKSVPADDTHLAYGLRLSLRDHLRAPGGFAGLSVKKLDPADARLIAEVALAAQSEAAGTFIADYLDTLSPQAKQKTPGQVAKFVAHAMRYASADRFDSLLSTAVANHPPELEAQIALMQAIEDGSAQRGMKPDRRVIAWESELAAKLLEKRPPGKGKPNQRQENARQTTGADIAARWKLAELKKPLGELVMVAGNDPAVRAAAAKALLAIAPDEFTPPLLKAVARTSESPVLREALAEALGAVHSPQVWATVLEAIRETPLRVQAKAAAAMCATAEGGEVILKTVSAGKLPPRLLQDRAVAERLLACGIPDAQARIATLTKGLPSASEDVQRSIDLHRLFYPKTPGNLEHGAAVFAKSCVVCHSIDGKGATIGPQLDGIGNRGLERVLEDVLDPNRSVDPAFRYSILTLKSADVITGLVRRDEGELLTIADSTGKEIKIPKAQIKSRRESTLSLMPTNFGEVLPPEEFNDLVAFLLAHEAKK